MSPAAIALCCVAVACILTAVTIMVAVRKKPAWTGAEWIYGLLGASWILAEIARYV